MQIDDSNKVNILLSALQERYNAIHIIRARVESICTWTLGILVTATGLFIGKSAELSCDEKVFLTVALIAILLALRFLFLRDLEKGFRSQFRTAARIENILHLFEDDAYSQASVYPKGWKDSGEKGCEGRYFRSNYVLLYLGFSIMIASIWLF